MNKLTLGRALCLAALPITALGQAPCDKANDPTCNDPILEEVVVTATRTRNTILRSPLTMSLVDITTLDHSTANGIADILRDVPGVSVSDSGEAGMKRVRLRGEESRRVAVLIDGQELTDHREVGVPLLIDPELIERIEVVRGPASVLYGAKALSGVVNIITRKGGDEPFEGTVSTTYDSATEGWHQSLSAFGALGPWSYRAFAARNRQQDRDTPAGEIENTSYQSDSASLQGTRTFEHGSFALSHDRERASSEVYVAPEVRFTPPFLDFAIDVPQRDRTRTALFFDYRPDASPLAQLQVNAYRQIGKRQFNTYSEMYLAFPPPGMTVASNIDTGSRLTTEGVLLQLDWQPAPGHYLVTGVQYNRDRVDQQRQKETRRNGGAPRLERIHDVALIRTLALFAQDEWTLGERWSAVAGVRDYRVEAGLEETDRPLLSPGRRTDTQAIASASLLYASSPSTVFRTTLAEGYVYPSLLQLATGAYAGSRFINPQLDLTPETSRSLEFGMRHQGDRLTLDATLFASRAEDYIDHLACRTTDACLTPADEIYRNIGSSRARGLEASASYRFDTGLVPYVDLTWLRRRNTHEGTSTYLTGMPKLAGNLGVRYRNRFGGTALLAALYARFETGSAELDITDPGAGAVRKDGWHTLNLQLGLDPSGPLQLDLSFHNLTDRKYATATENLYAEKRSVEARLSLAL